MFNIALIFFCLLILLIVVARNHARGMTRFKARKAAPAGRNSFLGFIHKVFCGFTVYRSYNSQKPDDYGYEYSEYFFESEPGVILAGWHIRNTAEKGLVLLFNWFGGCKTDNMAAADSFLRIGYSVFLVDLRGHGDSSGMQTYFGYYEYKDVLAAVEYAQHSLRSYRILLYGVSLGAVASMKACYMAELNISGLILEAPFDRLLNTIKHRVATFKIPGFVFADLLAIAGGLEQGYNPYSFNPCEYAREIAVPVLLIYGRDDPYITLSEAENIMKNLQGKDKSRLVVVSGHKHGSLAVHDKEFFSRVLENFLR